MRRGIIDRRGYIEGLGRGNIAGLGRGSIDGLGGVALMDYEA